MDLELVTGVDRSAILSLLPVNSLKAQKRIAHSLEDMLIEGMIADAYDHFDGRDGWFRRAVLPQTWRYYRSSFATEFEIPLPPLQSITSIAYRDDAGSWVTVAADTYEAIPGNLFGKVVLALGKSWPSVTKRARAVRIEFVAGYPADKVPGGITRSIALLAGSLYEHREADFEDTKVSVVSRKIEYGIDHIGGRYKIPNDLYDIFGDDE